MIDEKKLIDELNEWSNLDKEMNELVLLCIDTFKRMINKQPKVGEWIPFNKKEPKEEGLYLCCFDDGFITTVEYEDGDWNLWADSGEVVAWQTLPEPYRVPLKKTRKGVHNA